MKPVLLWTDALVFVLLAGFSAYAWHVSRHPHLRATWARIARSRMGMAAALVLSVFVLIGLLDSLHLRDDPAAGGQSGEILSVLDHALSGLRRNVETSYSAPFATHSWGKQTVVLADGSQRREQVALKFVDLDVPVATMAWRALGSALFSGVLLAIAVYVGLRFWLAVPAAYPLRSIAATLGTIVGIGVFVAIASQHVHVLGTDKVGQDVLYATLKSIRTAIVIGSLTTLVMLPFALALGIMAGYFRGWVDDVVQYAYTTLSSIPGVLLIAAAILVLQVYMANHPQAFESLAVRADMRLLFLCLILGITSWTSLCRLLRAETLKLVQIEYVQAAQALGTAQSRIMLSHILPNLMHIVLITIVLDFSALILAEAVLSYVNIGVDPSTNSWGNMINSARLELAREPIVWWSLMSAFVFMFVLVLAANLLADAVRDAFDPRVQ